MSKRKIAALSVGGLLALSAIGNAVSPQHPKPAPVKQAAAAPGKIQHAAKPHPKPKPYKGNCDPYKCYPPCRDLEPFASSPACDRAGNLYDRKQKARDAVAERKWERHLKAQEAKDAKQSTSHDCSSDAAAIAIVSAMSGNVGNAVGAGKIALDTAGTGEKC